jgi:hypothetical protein
MERPKTGTETCLPSRCAGAHSLSPVIPKTPVIIQVCVFGNLRRESIRGYEAGIPEAPVRRRKQVALACPRQPGKFPGSTKRLHQQARLISDSSRSTSFRASRRVLPRGPFGNFSRPDSNACSAQHRGKREEFCKRLRSGRKSPDQNVGGLQNQVRDFNGLARKQLCYGQLSLDAAPSRSLRWSALYLRLT